ncbi:MAG: energy transducer TonB [Deltaproteobacteria bacterium]|nr:energy transducer TonB [Deltaproteobacteria bacterium]
MAATADGWSERIGDDGRRTRVLVAFALSLACHALVLALARGWRAADPAPARLLVVTVMGRGGGASDPGAAGAVGGAAVADAASPVAPAAPGAVAAAPPAAVAERPRPALPRRAARVAARPPPRIAERRPAAGADAPPGVIDVSSATTGAPPAAREAAPSAADAALVATGLAAAALGPGAARGDDPAAPGGAGAAGGGSDRGSGHGAGGGEGERGDGLRAFCASCPIPDYPPRARRQGWQGTVDVALAIGGDGSVTEARVGRSSGYPALDEVALGVARRSRFRVPGGGRELRGQLRYRFVLDASAARR